MHRQLARDMRGGIGMHRQIIQKFQNILQTTTVAISLAQNLLGPRFGGPLIVEKPVTVHTKPRQQFSKLAHVVLGVTSVYPQRVKFQNFARQIFIQPTPATLPNNRVRAERRHLIQIQQHPWMGRDSLQNVRKRPCHIRADRLVRIRTQRQQNPLVLARNREMIRPECHQPFLETVFRQRRTGKVRPHIFGHPTTAFVLRRLITRLSARDFVTLIPLGRLNFLMNFNAILHRGPLESSIQRIRRSQPA